MHSQRSRKAAEYIKKIKLHLFDQRLLFFDPLVLDSRPSFFFAAIDRDRTVLRRSKPSSRTTFIGEQPNPWNLIPSQDVMSRHRGAKRLRQYGLSGDISLLSPAYLLSVDRFSTHFVKPDHYVKHLF